MPEEPPPRQVINWQDADFTGYSLQGELQKDISWCNISYDSRSGTGFFLVRFEPGAVSIAHEHLGFEEFVVLSGELVEFDGTVYGPGACVSLAPGTRHFTRSPQGATVAVFVRGGFRTLPEQEGQALTAKALAAKALAAKG